MYLKPLKIGDVTLKNNILLAPMAGVTNLAFRKIVEKFNPGLVYTEMISSKAIFYDDRKTKELMNTKGEKRPIAFQIFGSDVEAMAYAARYITPLADIIDINIGCPAPKVVKNGDGSKLLLDEEKAEKIIHAIVENTDKPVTVKIRKGWDNDHIVAVPFAQMIEKAGASAITIHGRTRSEFYSGTADLSTIKAVKEAVTIPVIGNGDIVDEKSALAMFEQTNVDGIMIGRGSFGNPWIFEQIQCFLKTGEKMNPISQAERLAIVREHIKYELEEKPELTAIRELRKVIAWYTKNSPNSSEFRRNINQVESKKELVQLLEEFFSKENE